MIIFKNQSPWGSPPGSGGSGNGGGFRRGPTPPNLDETIKKLQDTINKFTGSGTGSNPVVGTKFFYEISTGIGLSLK